MGSQPGDDSSTALHHLTALLVRQEERMQRLEKRLQWGLGLVVVLALVGLLNWTPPAQANVGDLITDLKVDMKHLNSILQKVDEMVTALDTKSPKTGKSPIESLGNLLETTNVIVTDLSKSNNLAFLSSLGGMLNDMHVMSTRMVSMDQNMAVMSQHMVRMAYDMHTMTGNVAPTMHRMGSIMSMVPW